MEAAIKYLKGLCEKHKAIKHEDRYNIRFFGPNWDAFIHAGKYPDIVVFRHPIVSRFEKQGGAIMEVVQFGFSILMVNKDISDKGINDTLAKTKAIGKQMIAKIKHDRKNPGCIKEIMYFDADGVTTFEDGPHDHGYIGTGFKLPMRMDAQITYDPTQWQ